MSLKIFIEHQIHVIYHANCYDGFGSAFILWKIADEKGLLNKVHFYPCNYGEEFPLDLNEVAKEDHVYILDFSFKRDVCESIYKHFAKTVILDHHKTAEEDLRDLPYAYFDMNKSGVGLTFDYCLCRLNDFEESLPDNKNYFYLDEMDDDLAYWLIDTLKIISSYIQDRDIFTFYLGKDTHYFYHYLSTLKFDMWSWNSDLFVSIQNGAIKSLLDKGRLLYEQEQNYIGKILERGMNLSMLKDVNGIDHTVPIFNVSKEYGTNVCAEFLKRNNNFVFCAYFHFEKGKIVFGIRSIEDHDCSLIAKNYGGGGHKNASGWVGDLTTINSLIKGV